MEKKVLLFTILIVVFSIFISFFGPATKKVEAWPDLFCIAQCKLEAAEVPWEIRQEYEASCIISRG